MTDRFDAAVIGAGFGGLGAALALARAGQRVVLFEAMKEPGGCASSFSKRGARYEAGATLFSGFGEGQLFHRLLRDEGLHERVHVEVLDPMLRLRGPGLELDVPPDRAALYARLAALPGAPARGLARFAALQGAVADALWPALDDPDRLPPFGPGGLLSHLRRLPGLLRAARWAGRPLEAALRSCGVDRFGPFRMMVDALCQITVQADAATAEAPVALATLDYPFRGTGHVTGGVGVLAEALCGAIAARGAELRRPERVRALRPDGRGWRLEARGGAVVADRVVVNLLPGALKALLGAGDGALPALDRLDAEVAAGWGAVMLYLQVDAAAAELPGPHHLELIQRADLPLIEGNHLFCSVSGADEPGRAPPGLRTATVSTHLRMGPFRKLPPAAQGERVAEVQERMRAGLRALAPGLWAGVRDELTASPRTFARFTGRPQGLVGGVPRRAGIGAYAGLWPRAVLPGLWLVGDSVFPGQSTLATALGGLRTARAALRSGG